jgi:membrane protein implicated in regulation of membrane protease activity
MELTTIQMVWIGSFVLFLVWELITADITALWFLGGVSIAFILSLLNLPIIIQVAGFGGSTFISYRLIRDFKPQTVMFNADSIIGKLAVVKSDISKHNDGTILYRAQIWKARSADDSHISVESVVEVIDIEGVTAIVRIKQ